MSQILIELIKMANLIITITKAVACGNRIEGIFEIKSSLELKEVRETLNKNTEVELSSIKSRIGKKTIILENICKFSREIRCL